MNNPAARKPVLTMTETAALLGVTTMTLSRWIKDGVLPETVARGVHRRGFDQDDIQLWLKFGRPSLDGFKRIKKMEGCLK